MNTCILICCQRIIKRLAQAGFQLHVSGAVLDHVARAGYDPAYGARPFKSAIQNSVENPLAQHVSQGAYEAGDIITVDLNENGELVDSGFSFLLQVIGQAAAFGFQVGEKGRVVLFYNLAE